jgi:hypothetical protein
MGNAARIEGIEARFLFIFREKEPDMAEKDASTDAPQNAGKNEAVALDDTALDGVNAGYDPKGTGGSCKVVYRSVVDHKAEDVVDHKADDIAFIKGAKIR